MNIDLHDPKLCICGEEIHWEEEFCSASCEQEFHEFQYQMHMELEYETLPA